MLTFLIALLGILITIFLVIGVHEFGHFLMARALNIRVLRFSIGFGKGFYRWHDKKGTEYVLAAIPLGGYVKLLDENEGKVSKSDRPYAYNNQPLWKRIAVICAGPISNLIFAFILYWILFITGFNALIPMIGKVAPHSIAAEAGIQPLQEIVRIDNDPATTWTAVMISLLSHAGDQNQLHIATRPLNNSIVTQHTLELASWHLDELRPDPLLSLGIEPYEPEIPATIDEITKNSPASQSTLQVGDTILAMDNKPIHDWMGLIDYISQHPNKTIEVTLKRHGQHIKTAVALSSRSSLFSTPQGYLGIQTQFTLPSKYLRKYHYNLIEAIPHAWHDTVIFTQLNFMLLGKIFTGKVSLKSLGGPITIFQSAGASLNQGFVPFISFLAFLSISIGIINILPVPGLDGGHLLFQLIELIIRKPLSLRSQTLLYKLGIFFLLLVMIQAMVNDIMRL